MDPLSDVLASVRLDGALYLDAEFTAPWCIVGKFGNESIRARLGDLHIVYFHFLTEGACRVRLEEGGETLDVAAGDVVLFPRDDRHLLGTDLRLPPSGNAFLYSIADASDPDFIRMRLGGGGEPTRFVCAYLACGRTTIRPLIDALPRMLRIPMGDGGSSTLVRELLRTGVRESRSTAPGARTTLAKLAELLFVEAMRRYVEGLPPGGAGWLAGVRDPHVGRALAAIHAEPARAWTLDALAAASALSRSALGERFAALVGESPMQYLTRWRLALAADALRMGTEAIARIAERAGYESDAAFNRAFKREFGVPPAAWRREGATRASAGVAGRSTPR